MVMYSQTTPYKPTPAGHWSRVCFGGMGGTGRSARGTGEGVAPFPAKLQDPGTLAITSKPMELERLAQAQGMNGQA